MGALPIYKSHTHETSLAVLVDNTELGRRFRDSYVRGVRRLIKAGVLEIDDLATINTILAAVQASDWVVYIQPPPKDTSDPADVLKYLAVT